MYILVYYQQIIYLKFYEFLESSRTRRLQRILVYSPEYSLEYSNACTSAHSINTCNLLDSFQEIQHQSLTYQSSILVSFHLVSFFIISIFVLSCRSQLLQFLASSLPNPTLVTVLVVSLQPCYPCSSKSALGVSVTVTNIYISEVYVHSCQKGTNVIGQKE